MVETLLALSGFLAFALVGIFFGVCCSIAVGFNIVSEAMGGFGCSGNKILYVWAAVPMSDATARAMTHFCNRLLFLSKLSICRCICIWFMVKALIVSRCLTISFGTCSEQSDMRYSCNFSSLAVNIVPSLNAALISSCNLARSISFILFTYNDYYPNCRIFPKLSKL